MITYIKILILEARHKIIFACEDQRLPDKNKMSFLASKPQKTPQKNLSFYKTLFK
jgi:hypothetical protein